MERARIAAMITGGATMKVRDGRSVRVRPVRPADAEAVQAFVRELSDTSRTMRFFAPVRELTPAMLARLTAPDNGSDWIVVALSADEGPCRIVALAQYALDGNGTTCDLALVVADEWQGLGMGGMLIDLLVECAREAGVTNVTGDVLRGNEAMLGLARASGFSIRHSPIDGTMFRVERKLGDVLDSPTRHAARDTPPLRGGETDSPWSAQLPARSRSPANSSLQNAPPWKKSPIGSGASLA